VKILIPSGARQGSSLDLSEDELLGCFPGSMILQYKSELSYIVRGTSLQLRSEEFLGRSSGSNHIFFPAWFSELVYDHLSNMPFSPCNYDS